MAADKTTGEAMPGGGVGAFGEAFALTEAARKTGEAFDVDLGQFVDRKSAGPHAWRGWRLPYPRGWRSPATAGDSLRSDTSARRHGGAKDRTCPKRAVATRSIKGPLTHG